MDRTYLPVLLLMGFVVANAILIIGLSHLTVRRRATPEKNSPYESGIPPLGDARERFSIKFYMVAMLFIIFDIETVFMIPWAVAFFDSMRGGLALDPGIVILDMLVFILILAVGYVYIWKRGALQWE
jgi:NADH-quinone oxidoreductase subunit A